MHATGPLLGSSVQQLRPVPCAHHTVLRAASGRLTTCERLPRSTVTLRRVALTSLSATLAASLWSAAQALASPPRIASAFCCAAAAMYSQDGLVDLLKEEGVGMHADVERTLRQCDRGHYVERGVLRHDAYQDTPLPIGYGETISAPHMHATCLELLRGHLRPGARVLDVGSGSGYLATAMGLMVSPGGRVLGIEKHPELAEQSVKNVQRDHPELLESGVVELRAGNVLAGVLEGEEPFDAVHVGAAAASLPDVLVAKLRPGGRMVIPVGPQWEYQVMQCIDKTQEGRVLKQDLMHVRYVPLTKPGESDWEP